MWKFFFTTAPSAQSKAYNRFVGGMIALTLVIIALLVVFSFTAKAQTSQYASSVIGYSTQYSTPSWAAIQATGAPNVAGCADNANAWASATADGQREFLVLGFTTAQQVDQIIVYESYAAGAVDTVWLRNSSTGAWNNVWSTTAASAACPRSLTINITATTYSVDAIRIASNSPAVANWNEIDGVQISVTLPMTYTSSTTTQNNTALVGVNTTNNEVLGIQIVTSGSTSPLSATSFSLNTTGTTAPATDITNAKIWYTGTSNSFAATSQFGSTVLAPNGSFTFTGSQTLSTGTNYFWLSYDIPAGATVNNFIDGECTSLTVTTPHTPTVTAPAGNRQISPIAPPTFQCSTTNWGSCGTGPYKIDKPSCTTTNDLMIAHFTYVYNTGDAGITPPAGWTQIFLTNTSSSPTMTAFYKIATSSEPASYSFSGTSNGADQSMGILIYRGVDTSDPIESFGAAATSGTSHTTPCITATTDQAMIVALFGLAACNVCPTNYNCANSSGGGNTTNAWTPPAGMTERYDYGGVQNAGRAHSGNDVVQAAKGCVQKTATSYASASGVSAIIALRPSGVSNYYSTLYKGNDIEFMNVSQTSVSLNRPGTVKQNDLMAVHLSAANTVTGSGATPPAGWTLIRFDLEASGIGSWLYYKIAGVSEASTYTFSVSSGINLMGNIMAYSGINTTTPLQTSAGASVPSGTSYTTPSITTTSDSELVIAFYTSYQQTSFTPNANTNERYDYNNAQNHWKTISADDFILSPTGATGSVTATASSAAVGLAQIVAFNRNAGKVPGSCCGFITSSTLPIELISFSASCRDDKTVLLEWATATEINNDYFTIERSTDGKNFEAIGKIKGAGNSSAIRKYEFTDIEPPLSTAVAYYRLKQTDYDGKYEYFNSASVHCLPQDGFLIYPNPANDNVTIEINLSEETNLSITFLNLLGQNLLMRSEFISKGTHTLNFSLKEFPAGVYAVEIVSGKTKTYQRIIISK
ncbi:MAG: T9SS type A sorting domain-containing protein [Bacteroidetes bacterium]|nr:T9SS type A sorting domain-containing protein [Bacteroidota bacterium]